MLFQLKDSIFFPYYFLLRKWKRVFERELVKLYSIGNIEQQLIKADELARMATFYPNGYYCSSKLERIYLKAASLVEDYPCVPEANTVLHVMTQAYRTGGHTRVVERWMNSASVGERHTVVVLSQKDEECPEWLLSAAENTGGRVIFLPEGDILEKATRLRELASHYKRIILHTHMYDGSPIIAFGTPSFTTPIILFNHADHLFWLGVSIADIVADIKHDTFTAERRLSNGFYLGIPPEQTLFDTVSAETKIVAREKLGLDVDSFVCITTATAFKLETAGIIDFRKSIVDIANSLNVICIVIGPSISDERWRNTIELSHGKVMPVGEIKDKSLYYRYLSAADCYLGSFPFMSYTAMMDGVSVGLPLLQYKFLRQRGNMDVISEESEMLCHSINELRQKICNVKDDMAYREQLSQVSRAWLQEQLSISDWKERQTELYANLPIKHKINSFKNIVGKDVIINDATVLNAFGYSRCPGHGLYFHNVLNLISNFIIKFFLLFQHRN